MKIKLTANSLINLPDELNDLNFSHGYSVGPFQEIDDTDWKIKVLKTIDSIASIFTKNNAAKQELATHVAKAASFLNSSVTEDEGYLNGMSIQLNIDSPLNKTLSKFADVLSHVDKEKSDAIKAAVNTTVGHIYSSEKKMFIGSHHFETNSPNPFFKELKDKLGKEKQVSFVIYHEAAHAFQYTNLQKFGTNLDPLISDLFRVSNFLKNKPTEIESLNQKIKTNFNNELAPINFEFVKNLRTIYKEIYADVGALLLLRNQDILEKSYSPEKTLHQIDAIITARQKSQQSFSILPTDEYVDTFNHFTSSGVEYLKGINPILSDQLLSQEEIHNICEQAIKMGVSRILLSNLAAKSENIGQIKSLLSIENEDEVTALFSDTVKKIDKPIDSQAYIDFRTKLEKFAGEDWAEKYSNILEIVQKHNPKDLDRSIWHALLDTEQFNKDLSKTKGNKELLDWVLNTSEHLKKGFLDSRYNSTKETNLEPTNINHIGVLNNISKMREKALNSEPKSSSSIKLN